ncbi:unnamed protein product [Malus baccata var. baccata]
MGRELYARGIGVIIRDHMGCFVVAAAMKIYFASSSLMVEAMAARAGLFLVTQRGFHSIILESDSLQIVTALRDSSSYLSDVGHVIQDSKVLLSTITGAISTHVCRQANGAALRLTRFALFSVSNCNWFEDPPDLILRFRFEEAIL